MGRQGSMHIITNIVRLIALLQAGRRLFATDIANELNISYRQAIRYMTALELELPVRRIGAGNSGDPTFLVLERITACKKRQ